MKTRKKALNTSQTRMKIGWFDRDRIGGGFPGS
jgi:hypothetical protein